MSKSYFMSITLHLGLFVAALLVAPPLLEKLDEKEITVELIEPAPSATVSASQILESTSPNPVQETAQEIKPAQAVSKAEAELDNEIKVPTKKIKSSKAVAKSIPKAAKAQSVKSVKHTTFKMITASRAPVPETLDDIPDSDLDYDSVDVATPAALSDEDLDSEFSQADKKAEALVKAQKSALDRDVESNQQETDQELAGIENENKENYKAMSDSLKATRTKNAALLAEIKAGEEAQARAAAAEQAARARAAQLAAAKAAQQAAAAGKGNGSSSGVASGNGKVRSIENLRQRPGNPKPSYAIEERFRKEQGTVVFHAFVTSEGTLENFKLIQSTGYKSLDGKTLAALKKWKFYPGQQGWVEIPQTWNLKGEAEEMPTTLRRSLTRR